MTISWLTIKEYHMLQQRVNHEGRNKKDMTRLEKAIIYISFGFIIFFFIYLCFSINIFS
jgi:hypothetical protein